MNIYLIRHGESEGNVDKSVYSHKPDYTLRLTEKGVNQAIECGKRLYSLDNYPYPSKFYVSPYWRARDTYYGICEGLRQEDNKNMHLDILKQRCNKKSLGFHIIGDFYEDSRLREQEWGQVPGVGFNQNLENQRDSFGHYFYRFPGGESCADVEDRISSFLGTMWRDIQENDLRNIFIITHGMTMRVFIKRFFKMSPEEFELLKNPENCGIYHIKQDYDGHFYMPDGFKPSKYEEKSCKHEYSLPDFIKDI